MTSTGLREGKIELIPHGIPDLPFVDSSYYKHKFGIEGRKDNPYIRSAE